MKRIANYILLLCLFLTVGCSSKGYTTIDANEAMNLINSYEVVIIDVREESEYNEGHIDNAVNIPLGQISSITYDKDTYLLVYCASGVRSLSAVQELSKLGYTNLYNLDGGLINWGF